MFSKAFKNAFDIVFYPSSNTSFPSFLLKIIPIFTISLSCIILLLLDIYVLQLPFFPQCPVSCSLQVDLTEYVERHEFVFDAVLNEDVTNEEVSI